MSKGKFFASTWLKEQESKSSQTQANSCDSRDTISNSYRQFLGVNTAQAIPTQLDQNTALKSPFSASDYFTPGWSGDSLFSKNAKNVKTLQESLWKDAKSKLSSPNGFNKKLKMTIHEDFLATSLVNSEHELCDLSTFWYEFTKTQSNYSDTMEKFCDLYSFKLATIYLFKLRLVATLNFELNVSLTESQCLNPSSFLTKFFTRGSSSEIHCEAFKMSQYTWYRPSPSLEQTITKELENLREISLSQLMRLFSYEKKENKEKEENKDAHSHALSHKDFGLFLNNLLVFFPLWLGKEKFIYPAPMTASSPDIINTRFIGDHLESLLHSHWLAQESNLNLHWSELLCPDVDTESSSKNFIQVCQELHFITFLVSFAKKQGYPPKETIVKVMRQKYSRSQESSIGQESLFNWQQLPKQLVYDRVVINLQNLPKKNPHHYLLGKINDEHQALTSKGNLVVLTNQKLFVPSQNKKIEALLKHFTLESIFNLEKLEAKGEVPNFIYIFKKRNLGSSRTSLFCEQEQQDKDSCMSFHFNGKLEQFSMFKAFTEELFDFFKKKPSKDATIYHKSLGKGLSLQFHQDTVKDGKLLSNVQSLTKDSVTHPSFFQSLTNTCSPLETFFSLEEIHPNDKRDFTHNFLGKSSEQEMIFINVLILNRQNSESPYLEICNLKSYPAKREEYGQAYFSYFGLRLKKSNININLLREYLGSPIGKQITSMCLSGISTKIKGRLSSLLLPNFICGRGYDFENLQQRLNCFTLDAKQLLVVGPNDYLSRFSIQLESLLNMKEDNWWACLSILAHLKSNVSLALEICNDSDVLTHQFYMNPLISSKLANLKTSPLHPNSEVFIDFHVSRKNELGSIITEAKVSYKDDQSGQLDFKSEGKSIFTLYGDKVMINFLSFLAESSFGVSAIDFIQGVEVPETKYLEKISQEYVNIIKFLEDLNKQLENELLTGQKQYILKK